LKFDIYKMSVQHLNAGELQEILSSNPTVLIDFYADWCGPCKRIAPDLEKLAKTRTSIKFVKVNVDECPEYTNEYHIKAMPTFVLCRNGVETDRTMGASLEKIQGMLNFN
jgi:thioredoxin 1